MSSPKIPAKNFLKKRNKHSWQNAKKVTLKKVYAIIEMSHAQTFANPCMI
tara:strand:- start:114 stop:263 length:150 start_codon:yes stop_codon:yes gene_type:complete